MCEIYFMLNPPSHHGGCCCRGVGGGLVYPGASLAFVSGEGEHMSFFPVGVCGCCGGGCIIFSPLVWAVECVASGVLLSCGVVTLFAGSSSLSGTRCARIDKSPPEKHHPRVARLFRSVVSYLYEVERNVPARTTTH